MPARKKSQKKASSPSTGGPLTRKQYRANFDDASATLSGALKAVERLEIDLKRIKKKLACFLFNPKTDCPVIPHGPKCAGPIHKKKR